MLDSRSGGINPPPHGQIVTHTLDDDDDDGLNEECRVDSHCNPAINL